MTPWHVWGSLITLCLGVGIPGRVFLVGRMALVAGDRQMPAGQRKHRGLVRIHTDASRSFPALSIAAEMQA